MSRIAITGNASGTGTLTIAAPNSNTDRTLTLPDEAGTIATVNGITEADMWRLATNFTTTSGVEDISGTFERVDDATFAKIGTGMSESSGLFTFPSTGLYLVSASGYYETGTLSYAGLQLVVSANGGSSFDTVSRTFSSMYTSVGSPYTGTGNVESFVNVTNTSNFKVKVQTSTSGATSLIGDTGRSSTWLRFIRLGDSQ
jgi:hypothetical protein